MFFLGDVGEWSKPRVCKTLFHKFESCHRLIIVLSSFLPPHIRVADEKCCRVHFSSEQSGCFFPLYRLIIVSSIFRSSFISILLFSAIDFNGVSIFASMPFWWSASCREADETPPSSAISCNVFFPKPCPCNLCPSFFAGAITS